MLEPGSLFAGHYRVVRRLGAGGMGAVYEAEQISTRKHRALKVLTNRFGADEKAQTRFVREATVGAEIDSDHVVDVIGAGIDASTGLPWLAMEMLDGLDLKRLGTERGPFEPRHLRTLFAQLGHGLGAAHAAGVIHRDLKPENIFVAYSRRAGGAFLVKILDFGIAKITREAVVSTDTATIGSPMWMAPEQINAEPLSVRTDVWALGLLAFWAITGRVYWTAAYGERVTVQALFAEQLFADLVTPSVRALEYGVGPRLPPGFDDWFAQCVVRDPQQRFADATAATAALGAVLGPWAEAAGAPARAMLPEHGAPAEASVARSEPLLSPAAGAGHAEHAHMAGTTADMALLQGSQPTVAGVRDVGSPEATDMQRGPGGLPSIPQQLDSGAGEASSQRRSGPAVGKIAALASIPAAVGGAAIAGVFLWEPAAEQEPRTQRVEVRGGSAGEVAEPPDLPDLQYLGEDVPATTPQPGSTGIADLSSLPAPSAVHVLGWTPDADRAALRLVYGSKLAARGFANYLELAVEIDGTSGAVLDTYVVQRVSNASLPGDDPLAQAAAASKSEAQWLVRRTELLLRRPESRREPARRSGALTMGLEDVPEGTRVQVQAKRAGFDVSWWNFEALAATQTAPTMHVRWVEGGATATIVQAPLEVSSAALRRLAERPGSEAVLEAQLRVYWSSDERHALITLDAHVPSAASQTGPSGAAGTPGVVDRRWFVVEMPAGAPGRRPRIRR